MSSSLIQIVQSLAQRVKALEAKSSEQDQLLMVVNQLIDNATLTSNQMPVAAQKTDRKMCPKCGVKPNHFFHVKSCQGQQEKEKHGEDANKQRDNGTT